MITVPTGVSPYMQNSHSDASYIEKKAVTDLYKQMKDQAHPTPTRSVSSAANLTSLCVDISPSSSNFFEVLYIGKIKVWPKKVPDTFIDDTLDKFKAHELEKTKLKVHSHVKKSEDRRGSLDSVTSDNGSGSIENLSRRSVSPYASPAAIPEKSSEEEERADEEKEKTSSSNGSDSESDKDKEKSGNVEIDDHNRTMVLQVDRTDLRLISPDRKVILLHKHHRDITTCVQGQINSEHFGFISREPGVAQNFTGYIFKCESSSIANDAVSAITQAFLNAETRIKPLSSCDHCPMVWFHKLCAEIEHLSDRKTQAAILRRLEQLDEEEQSTILTKFRGAETDSTREQNEFLMMLLRAHCESKQERHVHDTAENRSEFLNQYLGTGTIFMKAKRSLTNSFDQLLKRKASNSDFGPSLNNMSLPVGVNRESSPNLQNSEISDKESEGTRSRSSTVGSQDLKDNLAVKEINKNSVSPDRNTPSDKGSKSPMMDIFMKVGHSPRSVSSEEGTPNKLTGSWRQAIFKRVVTPSKQEETTGPHQKRTKEELRALWKKSIYQAILLVRMEKENARLRAEQEESAVKRIKLEYDEMKPNQREVMEVWEMVTNKDARIKCDNQMLLHAIRQGIPRGKRGEVWQYLAEQFCKKVPPIDLSKYPNYNVPYETLLKQLTSHQHAILIDLGRTFPNHSYYSSPLGPGQLALFNLLKAYSLLDPEVGYCQGLSFVAGVLLLHMEESQAFFLLRHLMFRRGLRHQYLPDMIGLQIKLYQLSRLLHDQLPDLYDHFDNHEVAPTLYAAPWLLTVFASQFPLGFVTRIFDLMFLESTDVIFRVILSLLSIHREKLLLCDSFEEIMNYLKTQLPNIDKPILDKIIKQVYTTDVTKQLNEYKVEYQVLQEEMSSVQLQVDSLHRLESRNKALIEQNKALEAQLEIALANAQRLEKSRVIQQANINKLEMHSRGLEVTVATLGHFINNLIEDKLDIEIPDDVRRIISQITFSDRRKNELKLENNIMKMLQNREVSPDKVMVKSLSTGRISLNSDQNMLRSNSLNAKASDSGSTEKISKFFSTSHNNILQQKCRNNVNIRVQDCENEVVKSISLPLVESKPCEDKVSPSESIDSGVGTPCTPSIEAHPLSNCDVSFSYNGTRELKNIRSLRNLTRNSSPDMLRK